MVMYWETGKEKRKRRVEMLALVTGMSSGTVVVHWVSIILAQEFIPYQQGTRNILRIHSTKARPLPSFFPSVIPDIFNRESSVFSP